MEHVNECRASENEVELDLLSDGDGEGDGHEIPKHNRQGCLAFLQRAWRKLTEFKDVEHDLDSLELYYLLGQCGNQIGSLLWSSILKEYNINLDGQGNRKNVSKFAAMNCSETKKSFHSFFDISASKNKGHSSFSSLSDLKANNIKARVICIDMEDRVVSRFSNSELKGLFDKRTLITDHSGSGNNWAEGYHTYGTKFRNIILKTIIRHVEKCDSLHGFLLIYSVGGGTGSGLGSFILEQLEDHFPHIERFVACVYPTGSEDVITAPFNMMLATQHLIRHATCVLPVENRCLQEISERKNIRSIKKLTSSIADTFEDMNSLVVDLLLHITSIVARENNFWNTWNKSHQMLKIDPLEPNSTLIAGMLFGRGDYSLTEMRRYIDGVQRKAPFLDWSRKCVKVGLCSVPPIGCEFSMLTLYNTSSITELFDCISLQHQQLLRRKAHIHHYTNVPGFELDYFYECQNTIADVAEFYEEIRTAVSEVIPRLQPRINYEYN